MKATLSLAVAALMLFLATASRADDYADTVALFKNAGDSAAFFKDCYGYAIFPTVGKGGLVVGAAHGNGRVYVHGVYTGDTSLNQLSVGLQAGGQAYSQVIFFADKRAFDEFTSGDFEFGADDNAVAITAAAGATAGTTGASSGASGGMNDATTTGRYYKGMAVFVIVKGGAMAQAAVSGQKFSYTPKS